MANTKSRGGKKQGAAHEPGNQQHLGVRTKPAAGTRTRGQRNTNNSKTRK